ncbi:hypothetical protein ACH47Z_37425 [Streptomyces sp. NPDC020192]|uniref:hypothetical protein n=1 Tax=Streptomyces sp. NPDC020192 TaxID=3365066 RepID=UPI00379C927F
MHTKRLLLRSGPILAATLALPVGQTAAVSGISVSTTGSTVSVVTSACARINGSWGNAALLTSRQANFAQGRQAALAGTTVRQSAAWSGVSPGTYTVAVVCSSGSTAGSQSVIVSSASAPAVSSTSSSAPGGVLGGMGGAARDYGPLTLGIGSALVGTGVIATGWCMRRHSKPYRL